MQAVSPRAMSTVLPLIALSAAAFSQTETLESASVKPNGNSAGEAYVQVVPGSLRMRNIPLRNLIQLAYGVEGYQISGGPSWIASDRFDIEAKASGNPSTRQMQGPMLLALLEDRFKLAVHRETKAAPVYELRLLDAKKIQPSAAGPLYPL
jgi:uncharacterized protein (TIGR03435 family)